MKKYIFKKRRSLEWQDLFERACFIPLAAPGFGGLLALGGIPDRTSNNLSHKFIPILSVTYPLAANFLSEESKSISDKKYFIILRIFFLI